jgi:uncharacterized iron-regulated membrane protein
MIRKYHRMISLVAGLFLLLITTTGVLLHVREFLEEGEKEERPKAAYNLASGMPAEWTEILNKGCMAVVSQNPKARIERVRIDLEDEKPRFVLQTGGEERMNYIIGEGGRILKVSRPEKNLLLRLHTGEIIGDVGEGMNFLLGLGLLILIFTGGVMLWDMIRAASSIGAGVRRIFGIK